MSDLATADLTAVTRREVRGLMRGTLTRIEEGETGKAATVAVATAHSLSPVEALELLVYARGHALGLNHEPWDPGPLCPPHTRVMRAGYDAGLREDWAVTLPAPVDA